MAQYTILDDAGIQDILILYGIEKIQSYEVLSGGLANTNYLVQTEQHSLVLTICEQKTHEEAKRLGVLLEYLKQNKFSTSKLVKASNGALTVAWQDKPVLLKEFIVGDIVQDLSKSRLIYLGRELAKLHRIEAPDYVAQDLSFGMGYFDEVQAYASESSFYKWLKHTQEYIENYITVDLPKSLIHSDIFYDNIIISKESKHPIIMDFEEACYYYRIFDIGMMLIGVCRDDKIINLTKVSHLIAGYEKEMKLLDIEKKALKAFTVYAATATGFWRHYNFNYVNIIPDKKGHYLEMKLLADSLINMDDGDFDKAINGQSNYL